MADLIWLGVIMVSVVLVSWVSYRAGEYAAQREAEWTVANLRRSNRVLRSQLDVEALRKGRP